MAETFGQPLSALRVEGYFATLQDLDIDDVLSAISRAMKEETFSVLPTPGKLRTYAQGTEADTAEAAWLALVETVRRVGSYRAPALPPALAQTVEAVWGGWGGLCRDLPSAGERTFDAHRTRFLAAYRTVQLRAALPASTNAPRGLLS